MRRSPHDEADDATGTIRETGRPTGETKRADEQTDGRKADTRRRRTKSDEAETTTQGNEDGHATPQRELGQPTPRHDGKRSWGKRRRVSERRE